VAILPHRPARLTRGKEPPGEATRSRFRRLIYVQAEIAGPGHHWGAVKSEPGISGPGTATEAVTALYQKHAGSLIRLAIVIIGDPVAAEDVVQDAFCGLYRRWPYLSDPASAPFYVRSAVLNGCRSVLRHRARHAGHRLPELSVPSAETDALIGEEHRALLAGLRQLPRRQREALALRFFADLSEAEIARTMGISRGTVKSTISRGVSALGAYLGVNT
jgi:RNA polymerase sigma-70 factor (sigma-E family)